MPKLPLHAQFDWRDQAAADMQKWISAMTPEISVDRKQDFDTGFKQGWDKAIAALVLHKFIERS
jgi:hypothetical protein